jgi:hypothetical protein
VAGSPIWQYSFSFIQRALLSSLKRKPSCPETDTYLPMALRPSCRLGAQEETVGIISWFLWQATSQITGLGSFKTLRITSSSLLARLA